MVIKKINKKGFSAIELVIVIAAFTIILTSVSSLTVERTYIDALTAKSREVVDIIEQARNYSMSGYYDSKWSINIIENDSYCDEVETIGCIVLFKGDDWNNRDITYDRFVKLNNSVYIAVEDEYDFSFDKVSGWASNSYSFNLLSNLGGSKTVIIEDTGLVYYTD